ADFNGDGHPDLVWQNDATRQVVVQYYGGAEGTTYQGAVQVAPPGNFGCTVVAVGDLNGDGHPDLVWQLDSTRQVAVQYYGGADGVTYLGSAFISETPRPGWRVAGLGDFDRDGRLDVIWQNDSTRQVILWYMGGTLGTTCL